MSNSVFLEAMRLAVSGLSVIPIRSDGTKAPAIPSWKPYQDRIAAPAEIIEWFKDEGYGLGVLGGKVSGNLEILDFDDAETAKAFGKLVQGKGMDELVKRLPLVMTPSGGTHLYYRCPMIEGHLLLAQRPVPGERPEILIETRGKGNYALGPKSPVECHELQKPYELKRGDLAAIPTITVPEREFLLNTARSLNEYVKPTKQFTSPSPSGGHDDRPGDRFNATATWEQILTPNGWVVDHHQGEETHWRRPGKERGSSATTNHDGNDLFYCFSSNGHPFESDTGYEKFTAYTLLNHPGDPSAASLELVRQGYGSPEPGDSSGAIKHNTVEQPGEATSERKHPAPSQSLVLTPLGDLLAEAEEEIPWLVDKHLPSAGLSILGGKPKAGKSVLSRCLALNVARGTPFLDFETAQGSVFYLGLEEKRAEVKNHFSAMGATSDDPISVFIAPSPQDGLAQLREAAERERPALIIVDPILKMVRVKDGNDYATMSAALEPVLTLARETGAHVLGVHHLSKGERSRGDSLLGSTAIFAAPDTALFYKRSERYRTLSSIQRYGEDLEEIVLVMDPETKIISAGGERKEVDELQVGTSILEYLKDLTEPVDEKEIRESGTGAKVLKSKALRVLVEQDKVGRTGGGKRGDPYLYSVSDSLAPTYMREPESQKVKTEPKCDKQSTYSGSQQNPIATNSSKPREPETPALPEGPKEAITEDGYERFQ